MAPIRVGVVGCGGIGNQHTSGLVGLDHVELVAGCDISQAALDRFKARWEQHWPDVRCYTDAQEMIANEALDILTVATPDDRHADPVVMAAEAGVKGIFCEKPMATTLEDADRMIEAVERAGTILSIDHTRRWMPLWRHIKEALIPKGAIGELQHIVGSLCGRRAMLFRNGTHMLDAMAYIADSEPTWVFAELEQGYEDYSEYRGDGGFDPSLEPAASGYIHFANGVRGFYAGSSKKTCEPAWRFEIVGSEALIQIVGSQGTLYRGGDAELIRAPQWPVTGIPAGVQELIRLVEEGGEPVSPARAAHQVVEMIVGFLVSQKRGNTPVPIPLPRDRNPLGTQASAS